MKIEPYPKFEEVFNNNTVKGIFYPLCKITDDKNNELFFVSHNGLWTDDSIHSAENSNEFVCFDIEHGKYSFKGDVSVYKGYDTAQQIFETLENDFINNGHQYLTEKLTAEKYIDITSQKITRANDFDMNYYLQTFYEFSMNKLMYQEQHKFGYYMHMINGFGKPDTSDIVYLAEDDESVFESVEGILPNEATFEGIGFTIGSEFFSDGNNNVLLFDSQNHKVALLNHYG